MSKSLIDIEGKVAGKNIVLTAEVKNKVAYLSIEGHIYEWGSASARSFKNAIKDLKTKSSKTEIYINSPGGSCFEINEMANIVKKVYGASNVDIEVGALAASAATYFLAGFRKGKRRAKRNSQFMIHRPMSGFSGNAPQIRSKLVLLDNLEEDYRTEYAAAFGKTPKEIDSLWENDYWMNAEQALKLGLISEIEDEDEEIDASTRLLMVACGAPVIPEAKATPTINNTETIDMDSKLLAAKLGLPSEATEAQINAALDAQKTKADTAEGLQSQLEAQEEETATARVKALLDQAELDKKITPQVRASYEALAKTDYAQVETIVKALTPIAKIEVNGKAKGNAGASAEMTAEQKEWTYKDFAENDPEAFAALDEATQEKLIEAHHKA